ncbi:MAG: 3-phosphoshikimate 1-carboxyvinyltransferase [Promethearchaeota archaeon]|jgi:3-phosphoshikimate 1-carboxyvinyltransferase
MNLRVNPINSVNGEVKAPPSKSYSHRAFIAASLAEGVSIIKKPLIVGDVEVSIEILKKLGVKILKEGKDTYIVKKVNKTYKKSDQILDCRNSGTSIRIFSALSLLIDGGLSFKGTFLRRKRPILPLLNSLKELGAEYQLTKKMLFIHRIKNNCNKIKMQGDISSQFITALLMICPLLMCEKKDFITIEVITPIASYPYIEITKHILESFGINIFEELNAEKIGKYYISSQQNYRPQIFEIPGDFSSIANIMVATILSPEDSHVVIDNLNFKKPQGDKKVIDILQEFGANIEIDQKSNQLIVYGNRNKNTLKGLDLDIYENPDLFPILAIVGAFAKNKTTLYNASNLRLKESDRISIVARELTKMGVKVKEEKDQLTVYQCKKLKGSKIDHGEDHRIAMAFTIAAMYADSISKMSNIEIIEDSYPNFIYDLQTLGAKIILK